MSVKYSVYLYYISKVCPLLSLSLSSFLSAINPPHASVSCVFH